MHLLKYVTFVTLMGAAVACGSANEPESTGDVRGNEPAPPKEPASGTVTPLSQPPQHGCGYNCRSNGIIELSWNACLHVCPGGASECAADYYPPCP